MDWSFLFFVNAVLFGVGLAMDAFSVSLADGLAEPHMRRRKLFGIAGLFGLFQMGMPLIGWVCVRTIADLIEAFGKVDHWIALFLLVLVGGNMIRESRENADDAEGEKQLGLKLLLVQSVATSIDALSVGFTMSKFPPLQAFVYTLIIGVVTFFICVAGLLIGRKAGTKLAGRAQLLGGIILILLGIEICVSGVMAL